MAVTVALAGAVTGDVWMVNVELAAPAGMNSVVGTWTSLLVLVKSIDPPPTGAAACSWIVPVAFWPPVTLDGETDTLPMDTFAPCAAAGLTVSDAETLFAEAAVMVVVTGVETEVVEMGNVADCCPAGTFTADGTVTGPSPVSAT